MPTGDSPRLSSPQPAPARPEDHSTDADSDEPRPYRRHLRPHKAKEVLDALLKAHPDLIEEAERLAAGIGPWPQARGMGSKRDQASPCGEGRLEARPITFRHRDHRPEYRPGWPQEPVDPTPGHRSGKGNFDLPKPEPGAEPPVRDPLRLGIRFGWAAGDSNPEPMDQKSARLQYSKLETTLSPVQTES